MVTNLSVRIIGAQPPFLSKPPGMEHHSACLHFCSNEQLIGAKSV
jgi:hypothetical protein